MFSFLNKFFSEKKKKREMEKKGLIGSRKRQTQEETFGHRAESSRLFGYIMLFLVWAASVSILTYTNTARNLVTLVPNQLAPYTVFAKFNFNYVDSEKTLDAKQKAKDEVPLIFKIDDNINNKCLKRTEELFILCRERKADEKRGQSFNPPEGDSLADVVDFLTKEGLSLVLLIAKSPEQKKLYLEQIEIELKRGIIPTSIKASHYYGQKIRIVDSKNRIRRPLLLADVPTPSDAAEKIVANFIKNYSPQNRKILRKTLLKVTNAILNGNLVLDEKATKAKRKIAIAAVKPITVEIQKDDKIIEKGMQVTPKEIEIFNEYSQELKNKEGSKYIWFKLINNSIMCLILILISAVYIYYIHQDLANSNQKICLLSVVAILSILANFSSIYVFHSLTFYFKIENSLVLAIVPIGLAAILLSVLIGLRSALYVGLFVSIIASLQLDDSFDFVISGLAVSCVSAAAVYKSRNYKIFFLRAVTAVTLTILILNYRHLWNIFQTPKIILWLIGFSVINGIITAVLSLILLFILESLFQVNTDMSLLYLCDYNHPLLQRLQFEAPGTYHHSLMVSTLAEHAAQEIGANPIKARVCALFHDIGKLSQPEYFTENDLGENNKHNELHPRMSSLVILNHVKEGIDIAIKYKLRKIIRNAIQQHHGTDLVYYFYKRAVEEIRNKDVPVEEQEYRYPGPLPSEKEVVLVSLADSCEAASRSIQKPSPVKIEALVWEIFRKRIRDGQLDAADLTFAELAKVRKSFVKTITNMLHGRIAYPKEEASIDENDLFYPQKKTSSPKNKSPKETSEKSS